ncbi:MAG: hypothetical protein JWM59_3242 [Verrucomicrobiales bacterium]|nr:hypothetical protein [Verrucomicrobiales bacterium]
MPKVLRGLAGVVETSRRVLNIRLTAPGQENPA